MEGVMTDQLDFIFNIPRENYEILKKKIERLSDKNEKIGLPRIFMMVIGFKDTRDSNNYVNRVWEIMISGEVPTFEGWEFIAKVDYDRINGNLIYNSPNKAVPEIYQTIGSVCEHCNHTRYRKTGYVILKDNEYKIVGSSCINKFINAVTPAKIAKYYETIHQVRKSCKDYSHTINTTYVGYIFVRDFIMATLETIANHGWYSATQAKENNEYYKSTAYLAHLLYNNSTINANYATEADQIIAWASGLPDVEISGNNFLNNIRVIARDGMAKTSDDNLIAGMVRAYQNKFAKKTGVDVSQSTHQGKIGDKIDIDATLFKVFTTANSTINKFIDSMGNVYVWFNHGKASLTVDKQYLVSAKIIAHNTFKNNKETIITRAKVTEKTA